MANKLIQHGGAAAATAAGGPIAGAAWEIGYPIVEDWLTGGSDQDDAAKKQQAGMQAAAGQYQAYRPFAQQARQTSLGNQLSAYGGAANAMNLMYGTQYDPRNYAPNLGKNPYLTGEGNAPGGTPAEPGRPVFTSADSQGVYDRSVKRDQTTPADIAFNATVPGALLTTAIAGGPDASNKELFDTGGQDAGERAMNTWMDSFRAQNGGAFPSDAETVAWLESQGRSAEADFYRKRNRGRA